MIHSQPRASLFFCLLIGLQVIVGCSSTTAESSPELLSDSNDGTSLESPLTSIIGLPDIDSIPEEPAPVIGLPDIDPQPPGSDSPRFLDVVWRLDAMQLNDGTIMSMPLDSTVEFLFPSNPISQEDPTFNGYLLCSEISGTYRFSDQLLTVRNIEGTYDECTEAEAVTPIVRQILDRVISGEGLMTSFLQSSMTLELGTNEKLFFSGRYLLPQESRPAVSLLVRGDSTSNENSSGRQRELTVYRDQSSFEEALSAHFPDRLTDSSYVDFEEAIVIGVFLGLEGYTGSDIAAQYAVESIDGLNIGITYKVLLEDDPTQCPVADAPSAPFALYLVNSRVQPLKFTERHVSVCSGTESLQFEQIH